MSEETERPFSFRQFLEKQTNLLTIFAVCNALIVYALTIKENDVVRDVLTICFWVFSLLTFFELVTDTFGTYLKHRMIISNSARLKLSLFIYAVVFSQLALVAYFTMLYPYVVGIALFGIASIAVLLLMMWITIHFDNKIVKLEKKGWSKSVIRILRKINTFFLLGLITLLVLYYAFTKYSH